MAPTSSIGCRDVRDATLEDEGLGLFPRELGATEVTVGGCLLVDRFLQVQIPANKPNNDLTTTCNKQGGGVRRLRLGCIMTFSLIKAA